MVRDAVEILSNSLRSTLFGKFYEEIFRGWFKTKGFKVKEGKPRIYWNEQPIPKKVISSFHNKLIDTLKEKQKNNHCIPDGLLEKNQNIFVWEAKNWPQWYETINDFIWSSPWILAKTVNYRTKSYSINDFILTWWNRLKNEYQILNNVKNCIKSITFEIFYTKEILNDCILKKPEWYIKIINKKQNDVIEFFKQLKGEK